MKIRISLIGWYLILLAFIALSLICLVGCRSVKYVEVEKVRTDTTYITAHQRDSIWLHDSLYIREYAKGDTVFLEKTKWLTKYVERILHDTIYKATHDTIPVPYPCEKKLSFLERSKQSLGEAILILLVIAGLWSGWKMIRS